MRKFGIGESHILVIKKRNDLILRTKQLKTVVNKVPMKDWLEFLITFILPTLFFERKEIFAKSCPERDRITTQ